jgi:Ca2+-binding EF-hand superfamily protein
MVARFDPDGDGVIKLDEMDERMRMGATFMLQRMGVDTEQPIKVDEVRKRIEQQAAERGSGNSRRGARVEQKQPAREAYRVKGADRLKGRKSYASTARNLPEGVPGWWKDKDEDKDGQITMAEFTTSITSKSRDEFLEYDLNDDGFITAQEAEGAKSRQ